MEIQSTPSSRAYLAIIALAGWFAIITQFYLMLLNRAASVPETIIRFFSFFTILTNLLVALSSTVLLLNIKNRWLVFFSKSKTATAITVYITIVGLVYNVILRALWSPEGMQKLVDELLHTVIPLLVILFWLFFVNCKNLRWKDFLPWLIYPLVYLIYTLGRGVFSEFYPYPFIDVSTLGLNTVLINSFALTCVFAFFALLFIGIGKLKSRNAQN